MENELSALQKIIDHYVKANTDWLKENMDKPMAESVKSVLAMELAFAAKLEALQLTTPQAEYARCQLRGFVERNKASTQECIERMRGQTMTVRQFFDGDTHHSTQDFVAYVKDTPQNYIRHATLLNDKEANELLSEECHALISLNTRTPSDQTLCYNPMALTAPFARVVKGASGGRDR